MIANEREIVRQRTEQAAHYFVLLQEGDRTESFSSECDAWRATPENAQMLQKMAAVWDEIEKIPLSALPLPSPLPAKRGIGGVALKRAACFAGISLIGGLVAYLSLPTEGAIETQASQWRERRLPDGTVVHAGPRTKLGYRFSGPLRFVILANGEVIFDVAEDPERPFVVTTAGAYVQAIGTKFALSRFDGPPVVVVKQGEVKVSRQRDDADAISVLAGQQVVVDPSGPLDARPVNVESKLAWMTGGWISLKGMTIGQAVGEFNRRNAVQIQIMDAEIASVLLDFTVMRLNDPQSFAQSLATNGKVRIDQANPNVLRLSLAPRAVR